MWHCVGQRERVRERESERFELNIPVAPRTPTCMHMCIHILRENLLQIPKVCMVMAAIEWMNAWLKKNIYTQTLAYTRTQTQTHRESSIVFHMHTFAELADYLALPESSVTARERETVESRERRSERQWDSETNRQIAWTYTGCCFSWCIHLLFLFFILFCIVYGKTLNMRRWSPFYNADRSLVPLVSLFPMSIHLFCSWQILCLATLAFYA